MAPCASKVQSLETVRFGAANCDNYGELQNTTSHQIVERTLRPWPRSWSRAAECWSKISYNYDWFVRSVVTWQCFTALLKAKDHVYSAYTPAGSNLTCVFCGEPTVLWASMVLPCFTTSTSAVRKNALNLSISIGAGKESNCDWLSNGE